jgi:hypothetical protein
MLYREIIAVCSEIHTKHINTLCGQNLEFVNGKPGGTYSNHWVFKCVRKASFGRISQSDAENSKRVCNLLFPLCV